jgi:hypothetical protein
MAQSGYSNIQIYASGTTGNTPSASNLNNTTSGSELAINYYDGLLFYKDANGNVQTLASKVATAGTFTGTGAITLPAGTTAQEPSSPVQGMLRFNTTTSQFEGYNGTAWASVGGAALSNDTTTSTAVYPLFSHATTGTALTIYTSNANYLYTPSTGQLQAPFHTASGTITGSLSAGAFNYGTLGYSDVNIFGSFTSSVNTYNQVILQNTNSGSAASTDFVVSNNNGTATTYYGDYGMNSSGWTGTAGTNSFNAPNMVYLTSTTADLLIGTTTSNTIRFATNGGADALQINASGNVTATNQLQGAEVVASNALLVNSKTVSTSYTVPSGSNAFSVGPITISAGVAVTVSSGSRWLIM